MSFGDEQIRADLVFETNVGKVRGELGEIGDVYARTTGAMSTTSLRAAAAHERLVRAIKRSGAESTTAKNATVAYRREMDSLNRDAARTTSTLEREERTLTRFGRGALAGSGHLNRLGRAALFAGGSILGGYGLTYALHTVISAASTLQEETEKTNVVFGTSAVEVQSWAKTLALSFGVSEEAALQAAGTFGNMLRPLHFGEQDAARMSQRLVELAADMASFNNARPDEVLKAISSGLAGQVRPLRQYGVFLSQTRIEQEAYAAGIAKTGQKLSQQQKIQSAYNIILKDTKLQQGDVARNTDSLSVSQSKLNAELTQSEATIGNDLRPELAHLANTAAVYLDHLNSTGQLQRDVNTAVHTGSQIVHGLADAFHLAHDLLSPLNHLLGGTRHTTELLALSLLLLKSRSLLAASGLLKLGGAAVTSEAEMGGAAGKAGLLSGRLTALTAAPWLITVAVAYEDYKHPKSIEHRAKGLFDIIKGNSALEQALETLPTVGPVIGAINDATHRNQHAPATAAVPGTAAGIDTADRQPGRSPTGPAALSNAATAGAARRRRRLSLQGRFSRADLALAKAQAAGDVAGERAALVLETQILKEEIASHQKQFRDKTTLYRQLTGITDQIDSIDQAAADKRQQAAKDAADKRKKAEQARIAAEKKRRQARERAAAERAAEAKRERAAQVALLTNVPIDLRIQEQTALAHDASDQRLLQIYKRELAALEQQIPIIRKLGLGKQAILNARRHEAELQKKIASLGKKSASDNRSLFEEAAENFRLYGSNVTDRNGILSPQDARGALGGMILRELRELNGHAKSTAHATGSLNKNKQQPIHAARALANVGI